MTRLEQLHGQWTADHARLEAAYAEAQESGADPGQIAQLEGMIAAYQQIIRDVTR